jgi:hypothetical protein
MKIHFYFTGYFVLICLILWLQYRKLNIDFFSGTDEFDFFFIHIYKNMGTTIHNQLPDAYNKKYYGQMTVDEYEKLNNITLDRDVFKNLFKNSLYTNNNRVSFDHIHLDDLYDLGILNDYDIKNKKCIGIIREPIERFISICNFIDSTPAKLINKIKTQGDISDQYKQSSFYDQKYGWNIELFKMDDKDKIIQWFEQFGIDINLDITKNTSNHKYTINDLTYDQISYLKELYKEDYELYNSL